MPAMGNARISFRKSSSHGAFLGSNTAPASILADCVAMRTTLSASGLIGMQQVRANGFAWNGKARRRGGRRSSRQSASDFSVLGWFFC
jgi:hypothetical protein